MTTRALLTIPALDSGGPDAVFFRLLTRLADHGVEPHLAVNKRSGRYLQQLPSSVTVHWVGAEGRRYPALALARLVRRIRPDVVMATLNMTLTAGVASVVFPRHTRLVLRQANHVSLSNSDAAHGRRLKGGAVQAAYRLTFRQADLVICQSRAMEADARTAGLLRTGSIVLPNPIDVDDIAARAADQHELPGSPHIISVGRLAPQKGFDLLLRALPVVLADFPSLHLTVVGEGPQRAELESLVQELGLEGHVTLAGFRDDVYALVAAADLVVSSSRYEGFANTTLEALALGKVVVGTDGPGVNDEMLRPGFNGWLVPPSDVGSLAEGIVRGLRSAPDMRSADIVTDVRTRFGIDEVTARYASALSGA